MSFTARDHALMARALELAARGRFTTRPNPMVGCVLADPAGRIVAEGWHQWAGQAHAEAHALQQAGDAARGATAYVTLEPCAHHGRTPPCADALVAAGVARVVVASGDPFAQVDGAGIARLHAAGVAVETGLLQEQARALNRGFFSRIRRGRPWLRIKLAMSLDGRTALADGSSQWISSGQARADVATHRAQAGALLTGIGTVLADDPRLTVRLSEPAACAPPLRVVLDSRARMPATARLLAGADAPVLWLTGVDAAVHGLPAHVEHLGLPAHRDGGLDMHAVLRELAARGINEVQVEAGATVCGALLRERLVDELLVYMAPLLLGAQGRSLFDGLDIHDMAARIGFTLQEVRAVGRDLRLRLLPEA